MALGDSRPPLPQRQDVHVVVDPDGGVVRRRESGPDRIAIPAGHDRRRDGSPGSELDRPRNADADAPEPTRHLAGRRDQSREQALDPAEDGFGSGGNIRRLGEVAECLPAEVRDRDVDARRTEIRDEQVTGRCLEGQLPGRPAAGARTDVTFRHEASIDELPHPLRNDRATQAGALTDLRSRPGAAQADLIEDDDQGVETFFRHWQVWHLGSVLLPVKCQSLHWAEGSSGVSGPGAYPVPWRAAESPLIVSAMSGRMTGSVASDGSRASRSRRVRSSSSCTTERVST